MGKVVDSERRFGVIAVKNGVITAEQLIEAIKIQVMEDLEGKGHRSIGPILHDMGLMTIQQVNNVHRLLRKPLYEL